jgi:RHS repeat-associated protein
VATGILAATNPYRFSTKYLDSESNLYYYGYRYYDSTTGRWTNRDLAEEFGGENLYRFVANNPIANLDFLGLWIPEWLKEAIYDTVVNVGKIAKGLPQRLLRNYIFGNGQEFILTKSEILLELKPITSLRLHESFVNDIVSTLTSNNNSFSKKYNLKSITELNGSLGNFTTEASVKVQCISKSNRIYYTASGSAKIKDRWDFDWQLWEYIKRQIGLESTNNRPWYGQWRTMVGSTIPGDAFDVTSEELDVQQDFNDELLIFK